MAHELDGLVPSPREALETVGRLPRGPIVPADFIPERLVRAFAAAADRDALARHVLRTAARLRQAVEPPGIRATVIQPEDLPGFDTVGAHAYWRDVFREARRHGPRMLAALVFAQSADLFSPAVARDRRDLLDRLFALTGATTSPGSACNPGVTGTLRPTPNRPT